jgi:hypothetical protein
MRDSRTAKTRRRAIEDVEGPVFSLVFTSVLAGQPEVAMMLEDWSPSDTLCIIPFDQMHCGHYCEIRLGVSLNIFCAEYKHYNDDVTHYNP